MSRPERDPATHGQTDRIVAALLDDGAVESASHTVELLEIGIDDLALLSKQALEHGDQ